MKALTCFSHLVRIFRRAPVAAATLVLGLALSWMAWEHLLHDWEDDWLLSIFAVGSTACLALSATLWTLSSARARALLLLSERDARLRAVEDMARTLSEAVEHSSTAVIITDARGTVEYVNPRFTELAGYTSEEVVGKSPGISRSGQTPREIYEQLWRTINSGAHWNGQLLNKRKDGQPYWVSATIAPIKNAEGTITHFVGIQEDVTALKERAEALGRAKEAAEAASRAKSEFLASMSHEIRTPMNAIIGMADLLWETPLNDDQRRYVHSFRSAGEALLNLINDILDLSKVEAGQIALEEAEFDLRELVERTCEIVAPRAHEKGIELAYRLPPEAPSHLIGDSGRLRQIITNLLGNAVKFTHHGEVVLEVGLEGTGAAEPAAEGAEECTLRFSVKDSGIGIPRDKQRTIFERFTQADSSTTRRYGGSGLGLAICRQLVDLMGGRLGVESEPGQGSTFSFTARFGVPDHPTPSAASLTVDLSCLRVLVVDDNATSRLILREMLAGWGAVVTVVAEGREAVAEAERAREGGQPYQLVVLDRHMPEMDGFQVADQLKAPSHADGTTLMMLTSDNWIGDATRCRETGIGSYLVKPVKRADLHVALLAALGRTAAEATKGGAQAGAKAAAPEPPLRLLLVDDSQDNRLLILSYLKRSPHQVDTADNGEVAVEKLKAGGYDLVLMDMEMPVMDGYAATRAIRAWEGEQGLGPLPIVALTAYALKTEVQKSLDSGCTAHLTKPIKKDILLEAIRKHGRPFGS